MEFAPPPADLRARTAEPARPSLQPPAPRQPTAPNPVAAPNPLAALNPVAAPNPIASKPAAAAHSNAATQPAAPSRRAVREQLGHGETERLVNRIPCGRCGELQRRGLDKCPRCGVADPENAEPVAPRKTFSSLNVPRLPVTVAVVGLLALGAFSVYTHLVKAEERKTRIWQALGSEANETAVRAIMDQAERIGVTTDALLRVRYNCRRREALQPSLDHLRTVASQAARDGRDPDDAVAEAARVMCKR